jgi:hypothetical protein
MKMEIRFSADSLSVEGWTGNTVQVTCQADIDDILNNLTPQQIIDAVGERELLEVIGEDSAKDHFELINA